MKKTTKTKAATALLTLAMALSLTACGHEHTWADATCTEPKTCSECGETEGEALGHTWLGATCTVPKTCSVCSTTEGAALGHTWEEATCTTPATCSVCGETEGTSTGHDLTEATFDAPATCTVCGETVGDVRPPDFVAYNVPLARLGEACDFILPCEDDESLSTTAHVTVTDYHVFLSDDSHPAKDGYEYRQATFEILYDDENAAGYGALGYGCTAENYYDAAVRDTSTVTEAEEENAGEVENPVINYDDQGQEYAFLAPEFIEGAPADNTRTDKAVFTVQVPSGYDRVVVGVYDCNTVEYADGLHIYDIYQDGRFVLFRLA